MKFLRLATLIGIILCSTFSYAQYGQPEGGNPLVKSIVIKSTDSTLSKDAIYGKMLLWINSAFKSGKAVIDLQDKENAIIIGKPIIRTSWRANFVNMQPVVINYTMKIEIREGKIRLTTSDYSYYNESDPKIVKIVTDDLNPKFPGGMKQMQAKEWKSVQDAIVTDLIESQKGIEKVLNEPQNQNW